METNKNSRFIMHVPNVLTVGRLIAVPFFIWSMIRYEGTGWVPGTIFVVAAWTDFFDGWIARRYQAMSMFGKIVDPLADRLLIVSSVTLLAVYDHLPWWGLIGLVWRDLFMTIGYALVRKKVLPDVNMVGKTATFWMMVGIGGVILNWGIFFTWLFWAGFALSILAFFTYFFTYVKILGTDTPSAI